MDDAVFATAFYIALPALMGGIFFNLATVLIKHIPELAKTIKRAGRLNDEVIKLFKRILMYLEISFYTTYFSFLIFIIYAVNLALDKYLCQYMHGYIIIAIPVLFIVIVRERLKDKLSNIENRTLPSLLKNNNNRTYKIHWAYGCIIDSFTFFLTVATVVVSVFDILPGNNLKVTDIFFILLSTSSFLFWVLALLLNPLHSYFRLVELSD